MRAACEALRLIDEEGMTVPGGSGLSVGEEGYGGGVGVNEKLGVKGQGRGVGRLYRAAMDKTGVWDGVPIEYARCQTEFPARDGWNHGWTR
jgi:large subunit ribosomal protein L40